MKKIIFLAICLTPFFCFAQPQSGGNLTVFSEDGDKFTLVLNGEKQNETPQANIKIEDLPQPYYSAKIIFEDKSLAPISKSSLMITDAEGKMMDVTYRIRRDKNNKVKMVYYSMIPVPQDFMPPSGMFVRHYGRDVEEPRRPVQQTTTTTTSTKTNTVDASLNVPGMNMSISINDPDDIRTTHSTTTTTTTHSGSTHHQSGGTHSQPSQQTPPSKGCKGYAMSSTDFSDAKKTIVESSFDDTKLNTAKSIASANCLSADQIVQICKLFSFEESKLDFAKFAYEYCTDSKNYFKVNNVFSFSSSKDELSEFVQKAN